MLYKLDYNQDGKVNWIDAAAYLTNLIGPYILIIIGIITPIEREIKTTVITLGAGLAGTAQKEEKRELFQEDLINVAKDAAIKNARKNSGINDYLTPEYNYIDGSDEVDLNPDKPTWS